MSELYADNVSRNYIIEVENIGTVNCIGASYEISWDEEDFHVSGNTRTTLDTIVPGAKKQINLTLTSKPITNGYKNKEIKVTIVSYDDRTKTTSRWEDTVSVNYYKMSVPFNFRSEKPVQGVIKTPQNKTYYFKTSGQNGNCTYSVNLPWSSGDYVVTFLGASVETNSETKYSLTIDGQPPSNWDSLWGEDMFRYEAENKSVTTAPVLYLEDNRSFMYYLYTGAVQYFRVNLGDTPPEIDLPKTPAAPTVTAGNGELSVSWQAAERARSYEVWMGTTNNSANAVKYGTDVSGTSVMITGLTNGTTYYIWVKAKNNKGTSGFSPAASGMPLGTPGLPTVSSDYKQLLVSWTAVAGTDEYEVYYGTGTPTTLATTTSGTSTTITGLIGGTTYYVRLRAKNNTGVSAYGPNASGVPSNERSPGLYRNNEKTGNQNLNAALSYISANAISGDDFYIVLGANESISPTTLNYPGKTVGITLIGHGGERAITLASNGSMFTINSGVTLTLGENITLIGRSTNTASLVYLNSGNLVINAGAKISGNTGNRGGGISVVGGTVTINGGTISGNISNSQGGGIEVESGTGTFTMHGGVISGNTASNVGGGIYVNSSATFKKLPIDGGQNSGIIYGYEETGVDVGGASLKNNGGAVYTSSMRRNTTAWETDHIDTTTGRGLSANGNPPYGE